MWRALSFCLLLSVCFVPSVFAATGYIHMHPSGKGFIDDAGRVFIPNAPNAYPITKRMYKDDPIRINAFDGLPRENVYDLGARGYSEEGDCDKPPGLPCSDGFTYNEFFQAAAAAGITGFRIFLDSEDGTSRSSPRHLGLEPIPLGKYYVWDEYVPIAGLAEFNNPTSYQVQVQIDGQDLLSRYPNCRYPNFTDANCGSMYGPKLRKSLLTRMLTAADRHGVKVRLVLFAHGEDWAYSPWNKMNLGGVVNSYPELYTNAQAIAFMKRRIDFVINVWGDSQAIWNWEITNEQEYAPGGTDANAQDWINWTITLAQYVKQVDRHDRPVNNSSWRDGGWGGRLNSQFANPALDFVDMHSYNDSVLFSVRLDQVRRMEATYHKAVFLGEYWPWRADYTGTKDTGLYIEPSAQTTPPGEDKPYKTSKLYNFMHLIGSGSSTAARWHDRGLNGISGMDIYTLAPVYAPVAKYIAAVNWQAWNHTTSAPWETNVSATNTDFIVARSDGDQVFLLLHGIADTTSVTINGLSSGTYAVKAFDYITGDQVASQSITSSGSRSSFSASLTNTILAPNNDGYDRKRFGVFLIEKQSETSSSPTPVSVPGDFTGDGKIDMSDLIAVIGNLNPTFIYNQVVTNYGK